MVLIQLIQTILISVTPTKDDTNHNTSYAVTFDGNKAAKQIPLTYKANGNGAKTVTLEKGLDFTMVQIQQQKSVMMVLLSTI